MVYVWYMYGVCIYQCTYEWYPSLLLFVGPFDRHSAGEAKLRLLCWEWRVPVVVFSYFYSIVRLTAVCLLLITAVHATPGAFCYCCCCLLLSLDLIHIKLLILRTRSSMIRCSKNTNIVPDMEKQSRHHGADRWSHVRSIFANTIQVNVNTLYLQNILF